MEESTTSAEQTTPPLTPLQELAVDMYGMLKDVKTHSEVTRVMLERMRADQDQMRRELTAVQQVQPQNGGAVYDKKRRSSRRRRRKTRKTKN